MVRKIIIMTLAIVGYSNLSLADSTCFLIKKASLAISAHASNWSNSSSTRTPEGGAYKLKTISCGPSVCEIQDQDKFKMVYEPNHPDADTSGYVKYPEIDKNKEYMAMSAQAQILRQLGSRCPQKVKVLNNKTSAMVEYKSGHVKLDIFNFKSDSNLLSWVRETASGESQTLNF
jgi:flagellar basal body rod protein FlgC